MSIQRLAVVRRRPQRPVERRPGISAIAQRQIGAAGDPVGISPMLRHGRRGGAERALIVALKQAGKSEKVRDVGGGDPGPAGAGDFRFRRHAVAERELDPRLHDPRGAVVRIGLERVQELDPRSAHIARLIGGQTALIRRPAAPAGGEQGQSQKRRGEPQACSPYCFSKS